MRPSRTLAVLAAGLALLIVATACDPTTTGASGVTGTSRVAPASGALLGSYEQPQGRSLTQQRSSLQATESTFGHVYGIQHYYYPWNGDFPNDRERWWSNGGRTPMISWDSVPVSQINSGGQDGVINARARALAAFGKPILLRWLWEMDSWKKDVALGPDQFKKAWTRIRNRLDANGATNVEMVWCPTAYGFVTGDAQKWYPGDDKVDWICADGYNWAPGKPGAQWRSFEQIFSAFYAFGSKHPKPLMIGEFGAMEDPARPGRKAQWLRDAAQTMKTTMPRIKAAVYFNGDGEDNRTYVWFTDSTWSSKKAWSDVNSDPFFRH